MKLKLVTTSHIVKETALMWQNKERQQSYCSNIKMGEIIVKFLKLEQLVFLCGGRDAFLL